MTHIRSDDFEQRLVKHMIDAGMFSEMIEKYDDREGVSSTMNDLGDVVHYAIEMLDQEDEEIIRKLKLKKHQAGLVCKVKGISEKQNLKSEGISFDSQRLM